MDKVFVNGLVKSREKYLITERSFLQMASAATAEDAFKMLSESGFGDLGDAGFTVSEYEALAEREERKFSEFLQKYSPCEWFYSAFVAKTDFHNAEYAVIGQFNQVSENGYKKGGKFPEEEILRAASGEKNGLPTYLQEPINKARELFLKGEADGVKVSVIFSRARYAYMLKTVKSKDWKEFLICEIDAKNLSCALRSKSTEFARNTYIPGGKIPFSVLDMIVDGREDKALDKLARTPYHGLLQKGLDARKEGKTLVEFELAADDFAMDRLKEKRFESEGITPLLLYANYKVNEIKNVRIVFAGKLSGASSDEIKRRLRSCYAG